ncbi:hypothetical protein ACWCXH_35635 [Kitasatospora sp. NPDC001660]
MYSRLDVAALHPCRNCRSIDHLMLQFRFGSMRMQVYSLGSTVEWGGNSEGERQAGRFDLIAYPERCPVCGHEDDDMYVIEFSGDVISGYRIATGEDLATLDW